MDEATYAATERWTKSLFECIDAKDANGFTEFLTEGAEFVFGSAPPVEGRDAIAEAVDGFFSTIASSRHRINHVWVPGGTRIVEGTVTYERHDGSEVTVPFTDVFDMRGELIHSYRIYIDISPLYAS